MPRRKSAKALVPDWHLWSDVTRSVSPLPGRDMPDRADLPEAAARNTKSAEKPRPGDGGALFRKAARASAPARRSDPSHPKPVGQIPRDTGLEPRMHRRVRRGQVPLDASIDLHGMHQPQARAALHRFVATCLERGDRTILVITGKGLKKAGFGAIAERGVLRHMLPVWLAEPSLAPYVAGWEISARQHGGEGAFYVRLKRPRP